MKCVLLDIGGLRADRLGCLGGRRPTSPALDSLASAGLCCDAAFSSDAAEAAARAALFSGRFGIATGVVTDGLSGDTIAGHTPVSEHGRAAARPLLQEHLSAHGTLTAALSPFGRQPARWFYDGWQQVCDPWSAVPPSAVSAEQVNAAAASWLDAHATSNFFLYLTYHDLSRTASAQLSPAERAHRSPLAAHAAPVRQSDQAFNRHCDLHAPYSPRTHRTMTREEAATLELDYDARIRTLDDAVASLVGIIKSAGIFDQTALVVTSDRGLLLGECGCYGGAISTHYSSARVPLIIRAPQMFKPGTRLAHPCYTLDLGPTICTLFGVPVPGGYHGLPLDGMVDGSVPARQHVVCSHGQFTAQRALIADGWKLNRTWHSGFWDFPDTELFNVATDPHETDDRAQREPQRVLDMLRSWRQWIEQHQPGHADPLARIACDEPPGFIRHGQDLRARVRRGELEAPCAYRGRWA